MFTYRFLEYICETSISLGLFWKSGSSYFGGRVMWFRHDISLKVFDTCKTNLGTAAPCSSFMNPNPRRLIDRQSAPLFVTLTSATVLWRVDPECAGHVVTGTRQHCAST